MSLDFFAEQDFVGLLRYWVDCAGSSGGMPRWDGEVARIPARLLPNLIIVARFPEPVYRYLGSECVRRWGSDITGHLVYATVTGSYGDYIRAVEAEMVVQRGPVFSAAIYHLEEAEEITLLTTGRLFVPFLATGDGEPEVFMCVQIFRGPEAKLGEVAQTGRVRETERCLVANPAAFVARLEAAQRYHRLARAMHQGDVAREFGAWAVQAAEGALVSLPVVAE